MFDPERLLGSLMQGGLRRRGLADLGGAKLGLGLLGVVMAAFEHYSQQRPGSSGPPPAPGTISPPPPPAAGPGRNPNPPPPPPVPERRRAQATLVLRAMIAAAAADGEIDAEERARIFRNSEDAGVDEAGRRFLEFEMAAPTSVGELGQAARVSGLAEEVYLASLLAIEVDTPAELEYLRRLAEGLELDSGFVADAHARVGAPGPAGSN
jgi:uncharacterized membrane protein YebE (DUF533 family)